MPQRIRPIDTTFTPAMAYRASPLTAPLAVMVPVQGTPDTTVGDILSYGRGTQVVGNNYDTANTSQGSSIVLFEPLYTGADGSLHVISQGGSFGSLTKTAAGNLVSTLASSQAGVASAAVTWALLARQAVVTRWDADNVVSGSAYLYDWEKGMLFIEAAWASRQTPYFIAAGDPLITR